MRGAYARGLCAGLMRGAYARAAVPTTHRTLCRERQREDHSTAVPGEHARTPGTRDGGHSVPPREPRRERAWQPSDLGPAQPPLTLLARARRCACADGLDEAAGVAPSRAPLAYDPTPHHTPGPSWFSHRSPATSTTCPCWLAARGGETNGSCVSMAAPGEGRRRGEPHGASDPAGCGVRHHFRGRASR